MPIIPYSANRALTSLNLNKENLTLESITMHKTNKGNTKLNNQGILFNKIKKN